MVGAGRMARLHLDAFKGFDDVEVVAIASPGEKRKSEVAAEYGIAKTYSSCEAMLDGESLDGVIVSPTVDYVYDISALCLKRRLHTLVEKPPGLTVAETQSLAALAREAGVCAIVGLQRRFYSHILSGLEQLKSRGPLYSVVVEAPELFTQIRDKKKFSDAVLAKWILGNGIHLIDLLRFVGGDIKHVTAVARQWKETMCPDSYHALVEFKSGAVGQYISNWSSPGGWSLTAYGAGCRVDIKPMERGSIVFSDGKVEELPISEIDKTYKPGVYAQNRAFIDAARAGTAAAWPAVSLDEAVVTMQLVTMIAEGRSGPFVAPA